MCGFEECGVNWDFILRGWITEKGGEKNKGSGRRFLVVDFFVNGKWKYVIISPLCGFSTKNGNLILTIIRVMVFRGYVIICSI